MLNIAATMPSTAWYYHPKHNEHSKLSTTAMKIFGSEWKNKAGIRKDMLLDICLRMAASNYQQTAKKTSIFKMIYFREIFGDAPIANSIQMEIRDFSAIQVFSILVVDFEIMN